MWIPRDVMARFFMLRKAARVSGGGFGFTRAVMVSEIAVRMLSFTELDKGTLPEMPC